MPPITWEMIFDKWSLIAADLLSEYGFDVYDHEMMRRKRWSGFRSMLGGLFSTKTRVSRWYHETYGPKEQPAGAGGGRRRR